jgi:hypothetical protein
MQLPIFYDHSIGVSEEKIFMDILLYRAIVKSDFKQLGFSKLVM